MSSNSKILLLYVVPLQIFFCVLNSAWELCFCTFLIYWPLEKNGFTTDLKNTMFFNYCATQFLLAFHKVK